MSKAKTYKIKFKEFDKDEPQVLEIKTNDINFTVEQISRNRHIESMDIKEVVYYTEEHNNDILGPNGNLGV
jgi:hypothetical protein